MLFLEFCFDSAWHDPVQAEGQTAWWPGKALGPVFLNTGKNEWT
jgi:hypothetical protein